MYMKLKLARIEKKLTQKQLAHILNMSPATINKIELGKREIKDLKLGTVLKIANILEVSISDLIE